MIALSFSRLSTYEQCPLKFKLQYIDKTYKDDSDNPAFIRGSRLHKQCEAHILHKTRNKPKPVISTEVQNVVPIIDKVINNFEIISAESKLALDTNFLPCSWFNKATMYRAILDMTAINKTNALIIDFKSGKVREYDDKPTGQLHLASCFMFANHEAIQEINTAYLFIEHKITIAKKFSRNKFTARRDVFFKLFEEVNNLKEFEPKVNRYCHWCLATKDQCKFK